MQDTNRSYSTEEIEEIVNWTLSGLEMYYRDSNLPQGIIAKYQPGIIFRSQTFVDASFFAGKPVKNCRFVFASSKAAPLHEVDPSVKKWGLHTMNCHSIFKILDVYKLQGVYQFTLLHIPYQGIELFQNSPLIVNDQDIEAYAITQARAGLERKLQEKIEQPLEEKEWIDRTDFPIGLDNQEEFFALKPKEPLSSMARPLFNAIRRMTGDLTKLNEA